MKMRGILIMIQLFDQNKSEESSLIINKQSN